ncbi:MAG: hypothetical protein KDA58_00105 [Planctomycetaceae bacterium]|nr:hypothetical protein [Planctomycetaceae bacterium]
MLLLETRRTSLLAALLCCVTLTASAADRIPLERRVPNNTFGYFTCPDFQEMYRRSQDTALGQMLHDEGFDDFKAELLSKMDEGLKKAETELGMPVSDLGSLLSGELSVAVVRPLGQSLGVIVAVDIGDHRDIFDQLVEKIDAELKNEEVTREEESYDGTEIVVYTVPLPEGQRPMNVSYFVKDNTFVLGTSVALLETVIDRWDGQDDDCLAENELFQEVMSIAAPDQDAAPVAKWFFRPIELVMAGLSSFPETQLYAAGATGFLPALGLNKLKAMGGAAEMATEKYDSITRQVTITEPPASGLIKVFTFPDTITGPPDWVPETAGQYTAVHWDLQIAYRAIGTIYDTFQAPGAWDQLIDNVSQQPGLQGLHIKKDFIDVFSGAFQAYFNVSANPGDVENSVPFEGVVSFAVTDAEGAERFLAAIASATQGKMEAQDFQGKKLYLIDKPDGTKAAVGLAGDRVLLGDTVERVQNVILGRTGAPLKDSGHYQQVRTHLPATMSATSWTDASRQTPAAYEKLRNGEFDNALEGQFDFSTLPPYDVIRKYMRPAASYMIPLERGSMTVNFTLRQQP